MPASGGGKAEERLTKMTREKEGGGGEEKRGVSAMKACLRRVEVSPLGTYLQGTFSTGLVSPL